MSPVFSPSTSITIAAPGAKVFALTSDFSTWPAWNTFIPHARLLSSTSTTRTSTNPNASPEHPETNEQSETRLAVGQRLHFSVRMPFLGAMRAVPGGSIEKVTLFEEADGGSGERGTWRCAWVQDALPEFLLRTLRVNEVVEEEDEGGVVRCVYRTYMTFDGPFAWFVKYTTGAKVQGGLEMWARDLKRAAEGV